jgi:hypothetical protein
MFHKGTAGYGNTTFNIGQSYADGPLLNPIMFNPNAPAGQQWSRDGLSPSTVPRMYHSSATLLPDGKSFDTLYATGLTDPLFFSIQAPFGSLDLTRTPIIISRRHIRQNTA